MKRITIQVETQDELESLRQGTLVDIKWPDALTQKQHIVCRRFGIIYAEDPLSRHITRRIEIDPKTGKVAPAVWRAYTVREGTKLPFLIEMPWGAFPCDTWRGYLNSMIARLRYLKEHGLVPEIPTVTDALAIREVIDLESEKVAAAFVRLAIELKDRYPPVTPTQILAMLKTQSVWPKAAQ